jgi:ankyrin repeat protein
MGFFGSISKLFEKVPLEDGEVLSPSSSGSEEVTYADSSFYIDNGDGTVTDKRTGLMWMRCAAGQKFEKGIVSGVAGTFTWNHAIGLRLGFAGFNDWELPDIESLKSIVDLNRTNPAIHSDFFPSTPCSSFWSRTTSEFPGAAWMVHFGQGFSDSVSALKMCHVRFVRKLLPETLKRSLREALVECAMPRNDLVIFVHKNHGLINGGLFDNGRTMLHLAAQAGKLQIVEWLLQKGAEANAIDCRGDTPFDLATAAGATRIADYLKSRLPSQETTIQVAISPENNLEIQHGPSTAPAGVEPTTGNTAAIAANTESGTATTWFGSGFDYLLRDIESTDKPSASLMKALANQNSLVLRSGGPKRRTLLHHAALHGKLATVKYLYLRCGAGIDPTDEDGNTPLDCALASNAIGVADYLRSEGAKTREPISASSSGNVVPDTADTRAIPSGISRMFETMPVNTLQTHQTETQVATTAHARFIDQGDGTVRDVRTGLMWMRCAVGQTWIENRCIGNPELLPWNRATLLSISAGGFSDWRLPTLIELKGLIDRQYGRPAIEPSVFFGFEGDAFYWTATQHNTDYAKLVNFFTGEDFPGRMKSEYRVRLVRGGRNLAITTAGLGSGSVIAIPQQKYYANESKIALTAKPKLGSIFRDWSGDVTGSEPVCSVVMDADKQITAHFEEKSYCLQIKQTGTGSGSINRSPSLVVDVDNDIQSYPAGTSVTLIASAAPDSVFAGWYADASGTEPILSLLMDAEKSISAKFELKKLELTLSRDGKGSGKIVCTPEGASHCVGATVLLEAIPEYGSIFNGWSGDVTESASSCALLINSSKSVTANFSYASFALNVTKIGSGSGHIDRDLLAEVYDYGSTVSLTANAEEGSVFKGWSGDAAGLEAVCVVTVDSPKNVTAEFERLDIPDLGIGIAFNSVEKANMKSGDDAFIFYLSLANKGQKQIRVELPYCTYLTHNGEEIEQDAWLSGLLSGAQGGTIRADAFRKMGLVFLKSKLNKISAGDQLYVTISQEKPAQNFSFTFRCTDQKARLFTLVKAISEVVQVPEVVIATSPEINVELVQRIEALEAGLREALLKIEALQVVPVVPSDELDNEPVLVRSLQEVLIWLSTQDRVSVAELRACLLPLDLFPSAILDEINERALDLTGDIAFEECGDEIVVVKEILVAVIAAME